MFNTIRDFLIVCTASAFVAIAGAGCAADGDYDDDWDRDVPTRPDDRISVRIPSGADVAAEGRGTIRYRAAADGRVYLYDPTRRTVIDDRRIRRGQSYIVSPSDGKAWIDDERVVTHDFDADHEHRIYFLSEAASDRDDDDRDADRDPPRFDETVTVVPKSSQIVREGRGDLSFVADGVGTVYLYDVKDKKVVATHRLKKGQRFTVSPATDEGAVDGSRVFKKDLNEKSTYRLYFNLDV